MAKQAHPIDELKKELGHIRIDLKTGKSKQGHKVKMLKKQIARIYTLNNQSTSSSNN